MTALTHWISRIAGLTVLVIGDLILDEYLIGKATRLSREAPVPVLEFEERRLIPGGAANPSANITALESRAIQAGVVGADDQGRSLRRILEMHDIDTSAIITDISRPTTVKTRIMAHMGLRFPQQVARLDTLSRLPIAQETEDRLLESILRQIRVADAVLISDYLGGLLTPSLIDSVRRIADKSGALVTVDAQGNLDRYQRLALVKCNADEASRALQRPLSTDHDFGWAARELCGSLQLSGAMVITRGADGATLASASGATAHIPTPHVTDVYDTVGAGDTSIAVMTLAVAAGAPYDEAVMLANAASGIVVRRVGNYAPSRAELTDALRQP